VLTGAWSDSLGQFEGSKTQKPRSTSIFTRTSSLSAQHGPSDVLLFCFLFIIALGRKDSLCMLYPPGYLPIPLKNSLGQCSSITLERWPYPTMASQTPKPRRRNGCHFFRREPQEALPSPSVTDSLPTAAVMCELLFGVLPHLPSPFRVLVTSRRNRLTLGVEINLVTFFAYFSRPS
jgi:hypothetical protein